MNLNVFQHGICGLLWLHILVSWLLGTGKRDDGHRTWRIGKNCVADPVHKCLPMIKHAIRQDFIRKKRIFHIDS